MWLYKCEEREHCNRNIAHSQENNAIYANIDISNITLNISRDNPLIAQPSTTN